MYVIHLLEILINFKKDWQLRELATLTSVLLTWLMDLAGGGQAALAQRLLQPIFRKLKPQQWQIQNALLMDNRAMVVGIYCSGTQRQQERIKKLKVCIQIILR